MVDVMMLEDDDGFAAAQKAVLERAGLSVRVEREPAEAFESYDALRPKIVLVDLAMTDPTGVYWRFGGVLTIREFRRRFGDGPKIWVLTGADNPNLVATCATAGADDYVSKSSPPRHLLARLRRALRQGADESFCAAV